MPVIKVEDEKSQVYGMASRGDNKVTRLLAEEESSGARLIRGKNSKVRISFIQNGAAVYLNVAKISSEVSRQGEEIVITYKISAKTHKWLKIQVT